MHQKYELKIVLHMHIAIVRCRLPFTQSFWHKAMQYWNLMIFQNFIYVYTHVAICCDLHLFYKVANVIFAAYNLELKQIASYTIAT